MKKQQWKLILTIISIMRNFFSQRTSLYHIAKIEQIMVVASWFIINNNLMHQRRQDLEVFWEESIWVELKINKRPYLLGTFYSPKPQDQTFFFFNALDQNIEKAMEFSQTSLF